MTDFSFPLYPRSIEAIFAQMRGQQNFPPMNLYSQNSGETYLLEFAVAGYDKAGLKVEHNKRTKTLVVAYKATDAKEVDKGDARSIGIAKRQFEKQISTQTDDAEYQIQSTKLEDGILSIVLEKIPDQDGNVQSFTF